MAMDRARTHQASVLARQVVSRQTLHFCLPILSLSSLPITCVEKKILRLDIRRVCA